MTQAGIDHGAALVRLRALFCLLLFPFAAHAFVQSGWMTAAFGDFGEEIWDFLCLGIAAAGLFVRALDAGFHSPATREERAPESGRTNSPVSGIYSVVRYPLYFANALIFISVILLFKSFLFAALAAGAAAIYYRRLILIGDEMFIATQGDAARRRAGQVPAFFPNFSGWAGSAEDFSWTRFLHREARPIALVGLLFFTMEALEGTVVEKQSLKFWVLHEPHWLALLLASAAVLAWQAIRLQLDPEIRAGAAGNAGAIALPGRMRDGRTVPPDTLAGEAGGILHWLSVTHLRAMSALLVASFVFFVPGFSSLPVTSRDESRFAQPAKQMVETGNYIDIRLQEAPRYRKPIGIYWLQAGTVKAAEAIGIENARNRIEIYRIPSLMAAVGSVLLTYWIALAFVSRRYAMLAGLALAASGLLGVEARIATIDAAMLLASTAAFGALAYVYLNRGEAASGIRSWGLAGIFWTAMGASLLLKGPIIATILGLAVAALVVKERSVRWLVRLKPLAGLLWILLLVSPWYLAIYLETNGAFFTRSVSGDLMSRLLQPAEGHWGPPGYFWLLFWVSFWPAAVLAPHATAFAWINRADPRIFFLIAWIVPGWIMFELVVTKLPHYVLPLYPGIAILIACLLERRTAAEFAVKLTGLLWPAFTIAMAVVICVFAFRFDGRLEPLFFLPAALAVGLAAPAAWHLLRGHTEAAFALALMAVAANSVALYSALPKVKGFSIAGQLVEASRTAPCVSPRLASAGYHEPNLVFLGGTDTALVSPAGAADFLQPDGCRVAFVEMRAQPAFRERSAAIGLRVEKIAEVRGFDYSNWRHASFDVLIRGQAPR